MSATTINSDDLIRDIANISCGQYELFFSETRIREFSFDKENQIPYRSKEIVASGTSISVLEDGAGGYASIGGSQIRCNVSGLVRMALSSAHISKNHTSSQIQYNMRSTDYEMFPTRTGKFTDHESFSEDLENTDLESASSLIKNILSLRKQETPKIFGKLQIISDERRIVNSGGGDFSRSSNHFVIRVSQKLPSSEFENAYSMGRELDFDRISKIFDTFENSKNSEGFRNAPSGVMDIVLSQAAFSAIILESFFRYMRIMLREAGTVTDPRGELVSDPALSITVDPLLLAGLCSRKWDDHGCDCIPKQVVSRGILKDFISDHVTSSYRGIACSGNGFRSNCLPKTMMSNIDLPFLSAALVSPTNIIVSSENVSENVVQNVQEGVFISSVSEPFARFGKTVFRCYGSRRIKQGSLEERVNQTFLIFPDMLAPLQRITMATKSTSGFQVICPEVLMEKVEIRSDIQPEPCSMPCTI
ncbi:MAG: metallopeptidase TldD-related protein [Thaumarchaeota archaeon]|nr:metallopeptidase TldD-related protein [Nitrososphaerota archaeon]